MKVIKAKSAGFCFGVKRAGYSLRTGERESESSDLYVWSDYP